MNLVIFLLLSITYTSLGFDENGDFEYFFSLDYFESALRLSSPLLPKCFSDVKGMYANAAQTFADTLKNEVTDTMEAFSNSNKNLKKILNPTLTALARFGEIIKGHLPEIEGVINSRQRYSTLATGIEKVRKETETLKDTYNKTLIQLKKDSPVDAETIEDLMQTAYKEALSIFKRSALTFENCMNMAHCK